MSDGRRTRVGHCRHDHDEIDQYVGRGPGDSNLNTAAPGIRGWLGNPYTVEVYGRGGCIERFRVDFEERLESDAMFREDVAALSGSVLGCWCQRLEDDGPACHAEIIAEHADRLARELHTGSDQQ